MKDERLVMFSWSNFYLNDLQAGISLGKCCMDMAVKYLKLKNTEAYSDHDSKATKTFWVWADKHKEVNLSDGGDQNALRDILALFEREDNTYPWEYFREGEGLNMALTNVSIVIPEKVFAYNYVEIKEGYKSTLTNFELEVYNLIKQTRHKEGLRNYE